MQKRIKLNEYLPKADVADSFWRLGAAFVGRGWTGAAEALPAAEETHISRKQQGFPASSFPCRLLHINGKSGALAWIRVVREGAGETGEQGGLLFHPMRLLLTGCACLKKKKKSPPLLA